MPLIVSAHFPRSTILKPISFLTRREWLLSPIQALSLQQPADLWWPLTKRQRLVRYTTEQALSGACRAILASSRRADPICVTAIWHWSI